MRADETSTYLKVRLQLQSGFPGDLVLEHFKEQYTFSKPNSLEFALAL